MKDFSRNRTASELRRQHNSDLIRRMRAGEPLNTVDSKASWYPPRPIIKKDQSDMARLYRDGASARPGITLADEKVVRLTPTTSMPPLGEAS